MITSVTVGNGYDGISIDNTYSYCEGRDLIDVANWFDKDNRQRSANHPACLDGILTIEDFPN